MSAPYDGPERRSDAAQDKAESWHIKKAVDISLILVLAGQFALGVWYVSDFNAWRHETDRTLSRHDQAITDAAAKNQDLARELADRLARIETKIDSLVSGRR